MKPGLNDQWLEFVGKLEEFTTAVRKSGAVNVNSDQLRTEARNLVEAYFRLARPEILRSGVPVDELKILDTNLQDLLRLSMGRNAKKTYEKLLQSAKKQVGTQTLRRETSLGEMAYAKLGSTEFELTNIETKILNLLEALVPSAATSYEQAIRDLSDDSRMSYRGPANDLREALREVLDHLAPDQKVKSSEGFVLEKGQTTPTQKQKVRFILKAREMSSSQRQAPEQAVKLIEESTASITRASYTRTNMSTHMSTSRAEVLTMKGYVDSVLADLLEIHA